LRSRSMAKQDVDAAAGRQTRAALWRFFSALLWS